MLSRRWPELAGRFRLLILPLVRIEPSQVVQGGSRGGMLQPQRLHGDREGLLVEGFGLLILPLVSIERSMAASA